MKGFFRFLGKVLNWLSPLRQTTQAALIRAIATDLVRAWFQKHPEAKEIAQVVVDQLAAILSETTGVSLDVAERVIRSAISTQGPALPKQP